MALIKKRSLPAKFALSLTVLGMGMLWMHDTPFGERVVTLRYLILAVAGFISFITPYLLFPDINAKLIQLGNISGKKLLEYLSGRTLILYRYLFLFLVLVMFADFQTPMQNLLLKTVYAVYGILITAGLHFTALNLYLKVGPQSQFWQESERGRELRQKIAEYFKYPIDPGALPSLLNTVAIAAGGMVAVVIATILGQSFGAFAELAVGIVFFAGGYTCFMTGDDLPEKRYYHTNSFFSEFFGSTAEPDSITARRKVEQLWWTPAPLRANVWQFLQQIDRKLPAGRAVAAGHVVVWLIAYQKPDVNFMTGVWALFAISHQLFIILTLQPGFSPNWLLRWMGSAQTWFFSWFWIQVRWIFPLLVSMSVQLYIFGIPGWREQAFIVVVYLVSAATFSAIGAIRLKTSIK